MNYYLLLILCIITPLCLLAYALTPKSKRYIVLFTFSLAFYCIYSQFLTAFTIVSVISIFFAAKGLMQINAKLQNDLQNAKELDKEAKKAIKKKRNKQKKLVIAFTIIFNIAILVVLKYSGLFASMFDGIFSWFHVTTSFPVLAIGLPIGISYYTLTSIGYLIDVYRGKYEAETNIMKVAVFVMFFPQAYEGPIARYDEMKPQYDSGGGDNFTKNNVVSGLLLFLYGLMKKMVIADRLAILVSAIFSNYQNFGGILVVAGILAFTFQLYLDFSGFINMAEGISKMFGIRLAKNFRQPFFSQTVSEFWRRWHISLGAWCKDYIFYSVAMSKGITKLNKKLRGKVNSFFEIFIPTTLATLTVWLVMGIWHGSSWLYLIYGLYYFVVMTIGACLEPLHKKIYEKGKVKQNSRWLVGLRILRTFVLVNIGMLIFRAPSISAAFTMFGNIFSIHTGGHLFDLIAVHDFILAVIGTPLILGVDVLNAKNIFIIERLERTSPIVRFLCFLALLLIILIFGAYGVGYTITDALYGGF